MRPRFHKWKLKKCKAFLESHGLPLPAPNPWAMSVIELYQALTGRSAAALEGPAKPSDQAFLRDVLIDHIDAGRRPGLDAWRAAAAQVIPAQNQRPLPVRPDLYPWSTS